MAEPVIYDDIRVDLIWDSHNYAYDGGLTGILVKKDHPKRATRVQDYLGFGTPLDYK